MELVVKAYGDKDLLHRPCVDFGLMTGRYGETMKQKSHAVWQGGFCSAQDRIPSERWAPGQSTPLCKSCEDRYGACHFCRRAKWCTPLGPKDDKDIDMQKSDQGPVSADDKGMRLDAFQKCHNAEDTSAHVCPRTERMALAKKTSVAKFKRSNKSKTNNENVPIAKSL
jgi:hypothetical protein